MKIGTKIMAGFLVVLTVMLISSGVGMYLIKDMNNTSDELRNTDLVLLQKTYKLAENSGLKVAAVRGFIITDKESFIDDYNKLDKEDGEITQELIDKAISAEGKQFAKDIRILDDKYKKIAMEKAIPLRRAGKMDEATVVMGNELAPTAAEIRNKIGEYVKFREKQIGNAFEDAQAVGQKAQTTLLILTIVAIIIGLGAAFVITRAVAGPLKLAVADLNKMADGDYSFTVPEEFLRVKDEVGDLARSIDKMIGTMKVAIRKLATSAEQLASSSEELTASAEQSAQAANQVAESITGVAADATEQMNAANETSAVVEQLSAGIQQVAANTSQVAAQSAQAADKAKDGGNALEKAVKQMGQIETTVNASAKVVAKLGERSKEIGQIVDTISGIAGQTNLLALNAAIEAARAGEQGRGFAVVAEEVRKLAEQSQEAAKKIAELIGEIQGDTDKAVVAMNDGTREVKTGAEVVNAAGATFREITELVTQVSGQVKEILVAVQQMATGSQQIVGSVNTIDELSKKSAGESQSVSAATEEQLSSMEEIASSSQALATLAQDLQAIVAKFRV